MLQTKTVFTSCAKPGEVIQNKFSGLPPSMLSLAMTVLDQADFDNNYTPVSEHYPALTPSSYTVAKGDTLVTIAAQVYGDSSLWYLIANENGLKDDTGLVVGQVLNIPNQITNIHSRSDTFRKYDASNLIGDLTPTLPTPPPPDDDDGGCGGIGGILVAVVAIGAAIMTGQPGFLSAISSGLGLAAGSTAATIAGAVAAGAVIDTASQLASMAVGLQDGFNFKELGVSALSAFAGAEVASAFGDVAALKPAQLLEKGLITDAVGQGIGNAVGMTHGFNWAEFAGSGLRAELGATSLGKQLTNTPAGIGNDLIDVGLQALSNNGHLSAASVGASIGSNFVAFQQAQHIKPKEYEEEEEELAYPMRTFDLTTGTKPLDQMYTMDYLNKMQADREMFDRLMDPANLSDFRMPGVQDALPADLETLKAQMATSENDTNSFKPINIDIAPNLDQTIPLIVEPGLDKSDSLSQLRINDLSLSQISDNSSDETRKIETKNTEQSNNNYFQVSYGVSGTIGGVPPFVPTGFIGGGTNVGISTNGSLHGTQLYIQFQDIPMVGAGTYVGLDQNFGVTYSRDAFDPGYSFGTSYHIEGNFGFGESVGSGVDFDRSSIGSSKGFGKLGFGYGAMIAAGQTRTVTIATPRMDDVIRLVSPTLGYTMDAISKITDVTENFVRKTIK